MITVKALHREAMKFNDLALVARRESSLGIMMENYLKAFEYEKQAFVLYSNQSNEEPTKSILIRSVANLAVLSEQYRDAEKYVALGLAGDPPENIANELRDIYQQINFYRHLALNGLVLSPNELQLSISGKEVGHGLIKSNEFLNRIEIIEKLAYRTADRFRNKPFSEVGRPSKNNIVDFQPYLSIPRAASFAVTIRFGQSKEQIEMTGMNKQSNLVEDILENINLINQNNLDQLEKRIPDSSYRRNFLALTKQLAPDGDRIDLVGFTTSMNNEIQTVSLTRSKENISTQEILDSNPVSEEKIAVELFGILSFADSKNSKIKLTDKNQKDYEIIVPNGLLSDVVKPYFEESVKIKGFRIGKKIELQDIEGIGK